MLSKLIGTLVTVLYVLYILYKYVRFNLWTKGETSDKKPVAPVNDLISLLKGNLSIGEYLYNNKWLYLQFVLPLSFFIFPPPFFLSLSMFLVINYYTIEMRQIFDIVSIQQYFYYSIKHQILKLLFDHKPNNFKSKKIERNLENNRLITSTITLFYARNLYVFLHLIKLNYVKHSLLYNVRIYLVQF